MSEDQKTPLTVDNFEVPEGFGLFRLEDLDGESCVQCVFNTKEVGRFAKVSECLDSNGKLSRSYGFGECEEVEASEQGWGYYFKLMPIDEKTCTNDSGDTFLYSEKKVG